MRGLYGMYSGWSVTMLQDGPRLHEQRRILNTCIAPGTIPQYDHVVQEQLASFLLGISGKCVDPFKVLAR